ncbi:hypothetical protein O0I10_006365 [Lichtheimia ornata]|uniref:Uncharacterized protein n=1 Tax=Lichtheimia ornata TaxID=688661 RepID=A0AAD7V395_9FUNG|nr:uncharacterized protein O0I10_006365 [Lichtheimia ornata]KAJ8657838.1 hypothetical protein O0I10_006365 [Lichtheimia ornata]
MLYFWRRQATTVSPSPSSSPSQEQSETVFPIASSQSSSLQKFMNDPTRTTKRPDTVGTFYDPMSIVRNNHLVEMPYDITNTGA